MRRSRPLLASYFAYFDPCPTNTSTESSESTRSRVDSEDSVEVIGDPGVHNGAVGPLFPQGGKRTGREPGRCGQHGGMTAAISSPPLSDVGALRPLMWNETGLDGAACARPDLSHDWLRVAAGVYAPRAAWQEAAWMERYELLLEAAHRKYGEDLVLAGASAVAAYGLPLVGTVLRRVEVVDGHPGRVRTSLLRRHVRRRGTEVVRVGGHLAVALPDALIDLARWNGLMAGVAAMDAALHNGLCSAEALEEALERLPEIYQALVLGIRDYIGKNGFGGVVLGLSGGIDSALTLALAVDALGAERVRTVMMPSPYTADISLTDAKDMAARLGVKHEVLPIAPCFDAFRGTLANTFAGLPEDLTEENIQARIRGTLLMAISNKTGWLVLTTGNKSELAVGYSTLYGDMAGGFAPLKDVLKTVVYQLSNWRNTQSPVIPERIITRPPSAELRPDQTDQDSLPSYDVLDRIIQGYMEEDRPAASLVADGLPVDAVAQVVRLLRLAEYKRQQGPVGPRVTARAFGRDWRYPITSAFREPVSGQGA